MHLSDGEIKSYQDFEIPPDEQERMRAHLEHCKRCQERFENFDQQSTMISTRLGVLDPSQSTGSRSIREGWRLMEQRVIEKENSSMFKKISAPKFRLVWITAAIVAILALAFAFPGVRAVANNFLGSFRVQQFIVVQFNPEDVQNTLGSSSHFEHMLSEDVNIEDKGEPFEVADETEASAMAGIPIRLPTLAPQNQQIMVFPGANISFDIDLTRVGMLLNEIGQGDLELPPELDGAQVSIELPTAVIAGYGECQLNPNTGKTMSTDPDNPSPIASECTTLHQMVSPTISAPPELDVAQIGESFLQLIGMSPEEAALFSKTVDWTTTLLIPIPRHSTTYQEVFIDGVNGTLILQKDYKPKYMLLWVKDDIVYALTGPGDRSTALEIAGSLE
jgi:hypothetical protein